MPRERRPAEATVKLLRRCALLLTLCCFACSEDSTSPGENRPLAAEAGFLELPVLPVGAQSVGRLFYSFHSAKEPDDAPLLVFLNGGPGVPTSSILMAFGTGPYTLDPSVAGPPRENWSSYTAFANLLYIDTRQAGFSYDVDLREQACQLDGGPLYSVDAAELIFALLDFLDDHERLRDNPIVLIGESYGGTRVALMLYLLQHYAVPADPQLAGLGDADIFAPGLRERIGSHFEQAFASPPVTPDEVAKQFGWQVLIQPALGSAQFDIQDQLIRQDPDLRNVDWSLMDYDDARVSRTEAAASFYRVDRTMRDPAALGLLLGVELTQIAGLPSTQRTGAFRRLDFEIVLSEGRSYDVGKVPEYETELRAELGELGPQDAYYLPYGAPCDPFGADENTFQAFENVLARTSTFMTNARWDSVVYAKAVPVALGLEIDTSLPAGAPRPGVLHRDGKQIRFPTYEAGHAVTKTAGAELGEDVRTWLEAENAIRPSG
jgi:hypothetical protein